MTRFAPERTAACSASVASSSLNPHQTLLAVERLPDWTSLAAWGLVTLPGVAEALEAANAAGSAQAQAQISSTSKPRVNDRVVVRRILKGLQASIPNFLDAVGFGNLIARDG
jgi:hypothetical protein